MNLAPRVPFYSNTPDDTHCYQAALKMVLKHFMPDKEFSWNELEKLTAKVKNLWTCPTQGLINLYHMGFDVVDIDDFNIEEFVENGGDYLIRRYGKEVGEAQIKHSDILQEQRIYNEYLKLNLHEQKLPTLKDIKQLIDEEYLVICNINSYQLNNKKGYAGHFVVIYGYDHNNLYLHDSGLPPVEARKVAFEDFLKAWEYPDETARNIQAFKLSNACSSK